MATLTANSPRAYDSGGNRNAIAMIASDIIYEGAAVGIVDATGHARPLNSADRFVGFAVKKVDNSAGSAADKRVEVYGSGRIQLAVTGAVITDVGQPVYATDDNVFAFSPVSAVFIGFIQRWVSSAVAIVEFGSHLVDPWAHYTVRELLSGTKTFDAEDCGKLFCVDAAADDDFLTLPSIADGLAGPTILAIGAFGTTKIEIDPATADAIHGPDITAAADKYVALTKATQRRGDFVKLDLGDVDGYFITQLRGIWVREG